MQQTNRRNRGLTLIELVVVVAILAVLAMIVIPKLDGLQGNANHAVGATSASDTARYIQTYRTMKQRFPDGWDSLMNGDSLWTAANPGTNAKGLHTKLVGDTATAVLVTQDIDANVLGSLNSAGIYTLYDVNTGITARPSDMFTAARQLGPSGKVAKINSGSPNGAKIIDHVYRKNISSGVIPGTLPTGKVLVALGFGAQNGLIGSLMLEAPLYPNVDTSLIYGRNLALFEVSTNSTSRAVFKGVVAADGDLLDDLTTYMNKDI